MIVSLIFNSGAMLLTLAFTGRGSMIEANPVMKFALGNVGSFVLISNCSIIFLVYFMMFRVRGRLLAGATGASSRIAALGLDFSAMALPILTFLDLLNDVAVTLFRSNVMTPGQLFTLAPLVSLDSVLLLRSSLALRARQTRSVDLAK